MGQFTHLKIKHKLIYLARYLTELTLAVGKGEGVVVSGEGGGTMMGRAEYRKRGQSKDKVMRRSG